MSDCGDGLCDANCENCGTCPSDCPCNDGVSCTNDSCQANACVFTPNDAKCTDSNICNGIETCDPVLGCLPGQPNGCGAPVITCPPNKTCECDAEVCTYGDPVLVDDCSVNPTYQCTEEVIPGKLPQERSIIRTCTTTNDCGASAMCVQRIEIVDTTPPVITCPPDKSCSCDVICEPGVPITVTDNCDPDPQVTVEIEIEIRDCTPPQTAGISPPPKLIKTVTFTASDGASTVATGGGGNTAQCVQILSIVDAIPPVLNGCVTNVTRCANDSLEFTPPTCTDSCGACSPVLCLRSDGLAMDAPVGDAPITITCSARDECENSSSCDTYVDVDRCAIPALSEWGMVVLTLLFLIFAKIGSGRKIIC